MRVERSPLRGEAGRVAARVRDLMDGVDGLPPGPDPMAPRAPWYRRVAELVPLRLDPGRRAAWAMAAAVLVAALVTGLWVMNSRPRALSVSGAAAPTRAAPVAALPDTVPLETAGPVPAVGSSSPSSTAGEVVVDVAGKVRRPGLYHLPAGSRIDDAVTAAGGPRRGVNLSTLNLAAVLVDGQQIVVGSPGGAVGGAPPPVAGGTSAAVGASTAATGTPVSLNSATLEELETLPRVGPVTAQKILDYRAAHGNFTSIDQLKDVSGIGDVTFAGIAPLVTL